MWNSCLGLSKSHMFYPERVYDALANSDHYFSQDATVIFTYRKILLLVKLKYNRSGNVVFPYQHHPSFYFVLHVGRWHGERWACAPGCQRATGSTRLRIDPKPVGMPAQICQLRRCVDDFFVELVDKWRSTNEETTLTDSGISVLSGRFL